MQVVWWQISAPFVQYMCMKRMWTSIVYSNVIFKRHTTLKLFDEQCPRVYCHMLQSPTQGLIMLALAELAWSWWRPDSIIRKVSSLARQSCKDRYCISNLPHMVCNKCTRHCTSVAVARKNVNHVITYLRKSWLHD